MIGKRYPDSAKAKLTIWGMQNVSNKPTNNLTGMTKVWTYLKGTQCRFENLPVCSCSHKNNTLNISHSYS